MASECPKCGSHNVQKSSVVVDGGTTQSSYRQTGIGISSSGVGMGVSKGSSRSQTLAAKKNVSPNDGTGGCAMMGIFLGILIWWIFGFSFGVGISVTLGFAFAAGVGFAKLFSREIARGKSRYERQWYCNGCGENFYRT